MQLIIVFSVIGISHIWVSSQWEVDSAAKKIIYDLASDLFLLNLNIHFSHCSVQHSYN